MKKSKQTYYDKHFEKKWNNIKNISLKPKASSVPTVLSLENRDTITNPMLLLTSLIITLPLYLSNESSSTIFLQPTDKEKIANIISSFNSNKTS